jgi:predicted RNA-binding protein YlqC (UPF0109 family)
MGAQPKETLEDMLRHLGFDATVEEQKMDDGCLLDVQTDDSGRLIGRKGQTLVALQYILNRFLYQQDPDTPKVTIDVAGYRSQAREELIKKAQAAADPTKLATLARRRQMARNFTLPFPYYKVTDERTPQTCKDHPPRAALYCALNRKDRIKNESRRPKRNTHVLILWSAVIILPFTALLLD